MFYFFCLIFVFLLIFCVVIGVFFLVIVNFVVGVVVGVGIFVVCYFLFFCVYVVDRCYNCGELFCGIGGYVIKVVVIVKFLCQFVFCIFLCFSVMKLNLLVCFLFMDFSKLICSGSEVVLLVGMIEILCDVVEKEFGFFVIRLYRVFWF